MAEVIPAIIPESFSDLEEKVSRVSSLVSWVQIDVCDGRFVPKRSWPYPKTRNDANDTQNHAEYDADFEAILKEERALPQWEKIS